MIKVLNYNPFWGGGTSKLLREVPGGEEGLKICLRLEGFEQGEENWFRSGEPTRGTLGTSVPSAEQTWQESSLSGTSSNTRERSGPIP